MLCTECQPSLTDYVLGIVCCVLSVNHLIQTMFFVLYVVYLVSDTDYVLCIVCCVLSVSRLCSLYCMLCTECQPSDTDLFFVLYVVY